MVVVVVVAEVVVVVVVAEVVVSASVRDFVFQLNGAAREWALDEAAQEHRCLQKQKLSR